MRKFTKLLFSGLLFVFMVGTMQAQTPSATADTKTVTFHFLAGQDMFYIPYGGNDAELNRLYALVDEYRAEITSGRMPVHVEGYCASLPTAEDNFKTAVIRSNRVKSELITNKGLLEEHFTTKNHAAAYNGHKDMVVVTLRIPVREEPKPEVKPEPRPEPQPQPEAKPEPQPEPVVEKQPEPQPEPAVEPVRPTKPYCFAVRTNLLYDAFLVPTLGVEWRVSNNIGIKLDGSYGYWGDEHGKVQKIWLVSPEVRWYMGESKRFYLGLGANAGEYNIYKGMLGSLFDKDKGYQGKLYGGGLTVGYQLPLSKSFGIDFNLGLGYTRFEYDSFTVSNETRVFSEKDKTKNFWGPTQAGISLVWTLGSK